jgi:hypothetical protein
MAARAEKPTVEYRVAHWYKTFILGLLVASGIRLMYYSKIRTLFAVESAPAPSDT